MQNHEWWARCHFKTPNRFIPGSVISSSFEEGSIFQEWWHEMAPTDDQMSVSVTSTSEGVQECTWRSSITVTRYIFRLHPFLCIHVGQGFSTLPKTERRASLYCLMKCTSRRMLSTTNTVALWLDLGEVNEHLIRFERGINKCEGFSPVCNFHMLSFHVKASLVNCFLSLLGSSVQDVWLQNKCG